MGSTFQNFENYLYSVPELESVCDVVLNLDDQMRSSGIISDKGKILAWKVKQGIQSVLSQADRDMLLMETALGVRMRKEQNSQLGSENFTLSYGYNVIFMTFPMVCGVLCVSAEKQIDITKIPFLILSIVKKSTTWK